MEDVEGSCVGGGGWKDFSGLTAATVRGLPGVPLLLLATKFLLGVCGCGCLG